VIIPAFNEEKAIGQVIAAIPSGIVREIVVCNNNSTDNTALVARAAGAIVIDQKAKGYGHACLAGIRYISSKLHQPDIVVFIDGDFSDYPQEMQTLITPLQQGHDLVIGSRTIGKAIRGSMTFTQQFGNWLSTGLIRFLYGHRFTDLGPFRAIWWDKLLLLNMQDTTYGWTVEMQVKALKHHFACIEVPVSYRPRIGKSKISGTIKGSILAGHKIIWTILKCR
jgi:glycosyltransferase involved in cell wall biosynthesis